MSYSQSAPSEKRRDPLIIDKLGSSITFDGIPDEEAWSSIGKINFVMHSPVFGREPTENTDVRITYDDKFLYAGAI